MQQIGFFITKLTLRSTCFGHHYAHHQEFKIYTDGCCLWYLALWFTGLGVVWSCGLCVRFAGCFSTPRQVQQAANICINLELLMMGIMVPETCSANSKFCNKETNLLHLLGLLISTYFLSPFIDC